MAHAAASPTIPALEAPMGNAAPHTTTVATPQLTAFRLMAVKLPTANVPTIPGTM